MVWSQRSRVAHLILRDIEQCLIGERSRQENSSKNQKLEPMITDDLKRFSVNNFQRTLKKQRYVRLAVNDALIFFLSTFELRSCMISQAQILHNFPLNFASN